MEKKKKPWRKQSDWAYFVAWKQTKDPKYHTDVARVLLSYWEKQKNEPMVKPFSHAEKISMARARAAAKQKRQRKPGGWPQFTGKPARPPRNPILVVDSSSSALRASLGGSSH